MRLFLLGRCSHKMSFPSRSFSLLAENRKLLAFPAAPGSFEVQGLLFRAAWGGGGWVTHLSLLLCHSACDQTESEKTESILSNSKQRNSHNSPVFSHSLKPSLSWNALGFGKAFNHPECKKSNSIDQGWRWMYLCLLQPCVLWCHAWHSVSSYDYLKDTYTRLVLSTVSHGVGGNQ